MAALVSCPVNGVVKNGFPDAPPPKSRMGSHGFDLGAQSAPVGEVLNKSQMKRGDEFPVHLDYC